MVKTITMSIEDYNDFLEEKKQIELRKIKLTIITNGTYQNYRHIIEYADRDEVIEMLNEQLKHALQQNEILKNKGFFSKLF
jgi:DNA polymerase III sliding clamp (beta) subunit (PCNA family)